MREHLAQDGERVEVFDLARSDGHLELCIGRRITRERGYFVTNCRGDVAEISRGTTTPGAEGRIGMVKHLQVKGRVEPAAANQRPQRVQSCLALCRRSSRGNEALIDCGF